MLYLTGIYNCLRFYSSHKNIHEMYGHKTFHYLVIKFYVKIKDRRLSFIFLIVSNHDQN